MKKNYELSYSGDQQLKLLTKMGKKNQSLKEVEMCNSVGELNRRNQACHSPFMQLVRMLQ